MLAPEAVDLADVAGCDEGVDVVVADISHQFDEFVLGQQGLDLHPLAPSVTSSHFVERAATHYGLDYVLAYLFRVFADDADPLAF